MVVRDRHVHDVFLFRKVYYEVRRRSECGRLHDHELRWHGVGHCCLVLPQLLSPKPAFHECVTFLRASGAVVPRGSGSLTLVKPIWVHSGSREPTLLPSTTDSSSLRGRSDEEMVDVEKA